MAKKIVKVMPNTDVTWSLSKDGFITQSGTLPDVLSAETVESYLEAGQGKFVCTKYSSWYLINGDLYGCGNGLGQGSGTTDTVLTYTKRASNVKDFAASGSSCFYIDNNNDLYGAGSNYYGQQGDGTTTNVLTFVKKATAQKQGVVRKCPTCGAPLSVNTSGKCEYCGSIYNQEDYDWVLNELEVLNRR